MKPELKNAFDAEMAVAYRCYQKGRMDQAFNRLLKYPVGLPDGGTKR